MSKCKLVIKDEVNVQFKDLDISTRRKLSNAVKYFLPYARHLPAYKLGRWDGCVRFCDVGGRTYLNLLDKLIPIVQKDGYEIVIEDQRQPFELDLAPIDHNHFAHKVWPEGHPFQGQPIILRDHQVEVANEFIQNPQSLQEVATGAGKTLITAVLSSIVEHMGRSVIIVPNKDLVTQTEEDYINLGLDVGVYFGDRKEVDHTHVICTWQSLEVLRKKTKAENPDFTIHDFVKDVVCVIVDETHKAKADVLRDLLSSVFAYVPIRWGLTGTIPKDEHEFISCICSLGNVVNNLSSKELQDIGVLADLDITVKQIQDPPVSFKSYAEELKWLTTNKDRISDFGNMIHEISKTGNTLVLIDRIETGRMLLEDYPDWVFVSGEMKSTDRKVEYKDINAADNKVVIATYGVASTGINIVRIHNLVLFEAGKSFVRVIQSIGRSLRKGHDKESAKVYDVCSNTKYSKKHLTERKKYYADAEFEYSIEKIKRY